MSNKPSQSVTDNIHQKSKEEEEKKKRCAQNQINIGISCTRNKHQVLGMYVDAEVKVR